MMLAVMFAAILPFMQSEPLESPASERLRVAAPEADAFPNTTLYGYAVVGSSPRAIRSEMNRLRPSSQGQRHDAVTTWRYSARFSSRMGVCDASSTEATYAIAITLPDLVDRDRMRDRDRQAWDRYFAALTAHELNHARIAQHGAALYENALKTAPDCETAQRLASAVNDEVGAASAQYDRQTEHGRREGAVYPN